MIQDIIRSYDINLNQIVRKAANKTAILLDPDKIVWDTDTLISKINQSSAIFFIRKPCKK
jgi:hypothetical protein